MAARTRRQTRATRLRRKQPSFKLNMVKSTSKRRKVIIQSMVLPIESSSQSMQLPPASNTMIDFSRDLNLESTLPTMNDSDGDENDYYDDYDSGQNKSKPHTVHSSIIENQVENFAPPLMIKFASCAIQLQPLSDVTTVEVVYFTAYHVPVKYIHK